MTKSTFSNKKTAVAIALMLMWIASDTAYAEEPVTDPYGNVITWDTNGSGNEENSGDETIENKYVMETYSPEEQEKILQQISEATTEAPSENGWVTISLGDVPEDWSQNNIKLVLYRGNIKETIFLHRQQNWNVSEQLPVGHYTVYKASTINNTEKFHADINTFDVTEDGNVNIILSYGERETPVIKIDDSTDESDKDESGNTTEIIQSEFETGQKETTAQNEKKRNIKPVITVLGLFIILIVAIISGIGILTLITTKKQDYQD